jgi:hypothetical protein
LELEELEVFWFFKYTFGVIEIKCYTKRIFLIAKTGFYRSISEKMREITKVSDLKNGLSIWNSYELLKINN